MIVSVNGSPREYPAGTTVARVVAGLGRSPKGIAVAVNAEVLPRSSWPRTALRDRDAVEVLTAAQGG